MVITFYLGWTAFCCSISSKDYKKLEFYFDRLAKQPTDSFSPRLMTLLQRELMEDRKKTIFMFCPFLCFWRAIYTRPL